MDTTMWAGLLGLVGALVGGFATLLVGQRAVSAQKARDAEAESGQVDATLQAIRDEVDALSEVHMAAAGTRIRESSSAAPIGLIVLFARPTEVIVISVASKGGLAATPQGGGRPRPVLQARHAIGWLP